MSDNMTGGKCFYSPLFNDGPAGNYPRHSILSLQHQAEERNNINRNFVIENKAKSK